MKYERTGWLCVSCPAGTATECSALEYKNEGEMLCYALLYVLIEAGNEIRKTRWTVGQA